MLNMKIDLKHREDINKKTHRFIVVKKENWVSRKVLNH